MNPRQGAAASPCSDFASEPTFHGISAAAMETGVATRAEMPIAVSAPGQGVPRSLEVTGDLVFVLSCAASSFAFLALFLRFARRDGSLWTSLRRNAFGMYLVHYAFVSWLQYALLPAQMSGLSKGALAFLGTVVLSWGATALLRRLPGVARVL